MTLHLDEGPTPPEEQIREAENEMERMLDGEIEDVNFVFHRGQIFAITDSKADPTEVSYIRNSSEYPIADESEVSRLQAEQDILGVYDPAEEGYREPTETEKYSLRNQIGLM